VRVGDLVRPTIRCGGPAGLKRCEVALVTVVYDLGKALMNNGFNEAQCRIMCKCGFQVQFQKYLEVISESR
jgi:hypothetical protein